VTIKKDLIWLPEFAVAGSLVAVVDSLINKSIYLSELHYPNYHQITLTSM
jgi:hypothetical protein